MAIETPDYLIGIGGSGSGIVERFMKQEWLLDEVIGSGTPSGDAGELRGLTVDSATSNVERSERLDAEREITDTIDNLAEKHDEPFPQVDFTHYNYVEDTGTDFFDEHFLTSSPDISNLLSRSEGLGESWWLEADREMIGDSGFGNGVLRRRALSKALYHISGVHGDTPSDHPQNINAGDNDEVCMVVSLGGGTGSGSFIDMAADIAEGEETDIHLFAIIPDTNATPGGSEGGNELANAFAALSELEHMHLEQESPFTSTILLPYNQSVDDTHFEEAVVETILAYQDLFNVDNGQNHIMPGADNGINSYFPFIIAAPRIIEYNAGLREDARDIIKEYFATRKDQLETEAGLYEVVENYLRYNFPDTFGANILELTDNPGRAEIQFDMDNERAASRVHELRERLEDGVQGTLLSASVFDVAGIPTDKIQAATFDKYYEVHYDVDETSQSQGPAFEQIEDDRLSDGYSSEIVEQFPEELEDDLEQTNIEFEDDDDERRARELIDILQMEMRNIRKRRDLIKAILGSDPSDIEGLEGRTGKNIQTALINVVLDEDKERLRNEFSKKELEGRLNQLETELHETEVEYAELEAMETAAMDHVRDVLTSWWVDASEEFERITTYHSTSDDIRTKLNELNEACERKVNQVGNDAVTSNAMVDQLQLENGEIIEVSEINESLESIGFHEDELIDEDQLLEDVMTLINAQRAHEDYHNAIFFGGNAEEDYMEYCGDLMGSPFFSIPNDVSTDLNPTFTHDFTDLIDVAETKYDSAVEGAREKLEEQVLNPDGGIKQISAPADIDTSDVKKHLESAASISKPERIFDRKGHVNITTPESTSSLESKLLEVTDNIKSAKDIDSTSELKAELLGDELSSSDLSELDRETLPKVTTKLYDAYVRPATEARKRRSNRLNQLGSPYLQNDEQQNEESANGLVPALQRLIRLSDNHINDGNKRGLELYGTGPDSGNPTAYGPDFAEGYEDNYELSAGEGHQSQADSVYKRVKTAGSADLAGDPDDISESSILKNNEFEITADLKQSIRQLSEVDTRIPVEVGEGLQMPNADDVRHLCQEFRLVNMYMSRAFETTGCREEEGFDGVKEELEDSDLHSFLHPTDGLMAKRSNTGRPWTLSLVSFISGFTLDMLRPARSTNGYKATYDKKTNKTPYPEKHHTIGLSGNWDRWESFADVILESGEPEWWPHGSAYTHRAELLEPNKITELTQRTVQDDEDSASTDKTTNETVAHQLSELMQIDTFESTIDHN